MMDRITPAAAAAVVLQTLLWVVPAAALAQTAADSAASAATGVYPARPAAADSTRATGETAGTPRRDSTGLVSAGPDSAAIGGQRGAPMAPAGPLVVNLAPPDTVLMRACEGEPAGSPAPGLLAVVFRAGTSDQEKAAAAKAVGGALAGPTTGGGQEYVRLPADAPALTAAADALIREDPVSEVSPALCPPPAVEPVPAAPAAGAPAGGSTTPSDTTTTAVPDSTGPPAPGPFVDAPT